MTYTRQMERKKMQEMVHNTLYSGTLLQEEFISTVGGDERYKMAAARQLRNKRERRESDEETVYSGTLVHSGCVTTQGGVKRLKVSHCSHPPRMLHRGIKRQLSPSLDTLRLVLEPSSVPVKKRRRCQHPRLVLDAQNRVQGYVKGQACLVVLDTGAMVSVILWNKAKSVGLITGAEPTTNMTLTLWTGTQTIDVIHLRSVTIDFDGGVRVVTPIVVFPKQLDEMYDIDIILEASQLRRGRMVQLFNAEGSDLVVCRPHQLQRPARPSLHSTMSDVFKVRRAEEECHQGSASMSVLVDTGANDVYVSEECKQRLLANLQTHELPGRLELDLGGDTVLCVQPLEEVQADNVDFIIGSNVLCQLGAVYDHAKQTLDFRG